MLPFEIFSTLHHISNFSFLEDLLDWTFTHQITNMLPMQMIFFWFSTPTHCHLMEHLQVSRDIAKIKKMLIKYFFSFLSYPRITQRRENVSFNDNFFLNLPRMHIYPQFWKKRPKAFDFLSIIMASKRTLIWNANNTIQANPYKDRCSGYPVDPSE